MVISNPSVIVQLPCDPLSYRFLSLEGHGERGRGLTEHQQMAEHTYSHCGSASPLSQMRKLRPGDMQSSARGYTRGEEPFASPLSLCMMSQSPL